MTVTRESQTTAQSVNFAYDVPRITSVSPSSADTSGGASITLAGSNFGTSATATIGGANCPVTFQTHFQIVCTVPAG